jgi:hypothetical protein
MAFITVCSRGFGGQSVVGKCRPPAQDRNGQPDADCVRVFDTTDFHECPVCAAWTGFTLPSALALVLFAYGAGALNGPIGIGLLHGLTAPL